LTHTHFPTGQIHTLLDFPKAFPRKETGPFHSHGLMPQPLSQRMAAHNSLDVDLPRHESGPRNDILNQPNLNLGQ
jgi:hypothetical protein